MCWAALGRLSGVAVCEPRAVTYTDAPSGPFTDSTVRVPKFRNASENDVFLYQKWPECDHVITISIVALLVSVSFTKRLS